MTNRISPRQKKIKGIVNECQKNEYKKELSFYQSKNEQEYFLKHLVQTRNK